MVGANLCDVYQNGGAPCNPLPSFRFVLTTPNNPWLFVRTQHADRDRVPDRQPTAPAQQGGEDAM